MRDPLIVPIVILQLGRLIRFTLEPSMRVSLFNGFIFQFAIPFFLRGVQIDLPPTLITLAMLVREGFGLAPFFEGWATQRGYALIDGGPFDDRE